MYTVITYKDCDENDKITDYIQFLNSKMHTSKDSRIKYKKIMEYIGQLKAYGATIGEPTMKHIVGTDLWELRPLRDRILFACWKDDIFILLHHFVKKTNKTPQKEIKQAERNFKDFIERYGE